ncbi:MAG: prolyl-tRNA synthetase associated domain-containing protein [Lachnospiraceae bacterium]|nr:prolyl-tRNA synthetase associated domain-containing protein [Lachnospiraceae bacterium]
MDKQEVYRFLEEKKIWHEITEHGAVFNMEELEAVDLPYPGLDAKNLFVRDDKKRNYYLITVKGDKRVDLKEFQARYGTRKLSFASADDLMAIMGLIPGAVSPLGLLNDEEHKVSFFIDRDFRTGKGIMGIHPCDNTATVWLKSTDLIKLIRGHGIQVMEVPF